MPKKGKKTKASKQEKQAAKKKADELVDVGNGHLERALAARRKKNLDATFDHLALAESAYQQATTAVTSVHLDSAYNLGVCQSIRSNIYARQRKTAQSEAAHALAQQHFKCVVAGDTSGRSETLALAHTSLAALFVKHPKAAIENLRKSAESKATTALQDLQQAMQHVNASLDISTKLGNLPSVVSSHLQGGDIEALAMRWCFCIGNIEEAFVHCETACWHYDQGLQSPVPVNDLQLLDSKVKTLHTICNWAVENKAEIEKRKLHEKCSAALQNADATVKTLSLIPPEAAKGFGELLVVMGDICEMNGKIWEALQFYEKAIDVEPANADAHAAAADVLLDQGREKISSATGRDERAVAEELLRRSAEAFRSAAQLDVAQSSVHMYNLACASALAVDKEPCKDAILALQKNARKGGSIGTEASGLLVDIANDKDFEAVRDMKWFREIESSS